MFFKTLLERLLFRYRLLGVYSLMSEIFWLRLSKIRIRIGNLFLGKWDRLWLSLNKRALPTLLSTLIGSGLIIITFRLISIILVLGLGKSGSGCVSIIIRLLDYIAYYIHSLFIVEFKYLSYLCIIHHPHYQVYSNLTTHSIIK